MKIKPIFKSETARRDILAVYDAILARWPVPYEKLEVPTRHGRTGLLAFGAASRPPLLLLHGSSSNSAMWLGDAAVLSGSFRVWAVDLPGDPGMSEPLRRPLAGPAYAEWLEDVMSKLGLAKASLAGISLGAWMALKFAVTHPERVDKLALLCPSGIGPQKASFMLTALPLMLMGRAGLARIIRLVNYPAELPREAIEYSLLIAESFNPRLEQIPIFSDEELRRLAIPVLLIAGARDALLHSRASAERLKKLLPHARVELLAEAGHVLIDQADRLMAFLTAPGASARPEGARE